MGQSYISINGVQYHQDKSADLVLDRGFQFGDGIFESMRCLKGRIIGFTDHIQRFQSSARILRIPFKKNGAQIKKLIQEALSHLENSDLYIKLILSRGLWSGSVVPDQNSTPTFIVICKPFMPFSKAFYLRGLKVCTLKCRRNETSTLSLIKSLNYLDNVMGRILAQKKGFHEGLFLNTRGYVAEGSMSNIFCIRKKCLLTPPVSDGVLTGITRKWILRNAGKVGLSVQESSIRLGSLLNSSEVFLSNSLMGIVPVSKIDRCIIKPAELGSFTSKLQDLYQRSADRVVRISKE